MEGCLPTPLLFSKIYIHVNH